MQNDRDAATTALKTGGTDILKDANRFRELVVQQLDTTSKERRALEIGCDDQYLMAFSGASNKGELSTAACNAADYLTGTYVMDSEVASSVSYGIADAIAEFLGIDAPSAKPRKRPSTNRKSVSIPAVIALVISVGILAAGLYVAHTNPIFGCTLFPTSSKLANISCEWYGTRNKAGQELSVIFLRNDGADTEKMSCIENYALNGTVMPLLATGDEGLMVIRGLGGTANVSMKRNPATKESIGAMPIRQVTWSYTTSTDGTKKIMITNWSENRILLYANSLMLASRGMTANVGVLEGVNSLEPGTTVVDVTDRLRYLTHSSDALARLQNTDLYLNGIKVPMDSSENS